MITRVLVAVLLCLGILCLANAQIPQTGAGKGAPGGGGGGYVGPGNVVSGAVAYWGASGYTTSDTANAWNVCNVSDVVCADWPIGANGQITPSLVGGSDCGVVTCTIKTFYDRSGANACGGSPCHVTQATISSRAQVALNSINTFACAFINGNPGQGYSIATGATLNQPVTSLVVSQRNSHFTTQGVYIQSNTLYPSLQSSTANTVSGYAGTIVSATASDSAFHSIQIVLNTPTSNFQVDGTNTTPGSPNPGTGSGGPAFGLNFLFDGGSGSAQGYLCDAGLWTIAFTGTNLTNMNANRHAAYGTW